jgi:hypothetical protein
MVTHIREAALETGRNRKFRERESYIEEYLVVNLGKVKDRLQEF